MTREEAMRSIGDIYAMEYKVHGNADAHPIFFIEAMLALGVTMEEISAVADRAVEENRS